MKTVLLLVDSPLVLTVVWPGTVAAGAATADEDLAASAAAVGPEAVCGGSLWSGQAHLPAPSPVPGADHQAEPCSPLTEPAERVSWAGLP